MNKVVILGDPHIGSVATERLTYKLEHSEVLVVDTKNISCIEIKSLSEIVDGDRFYKTTSHNLINELVDLTSRAKGVNTIIK